jgi:GH25 family lysozyme M1 (1,4-beta-N-acetylmuramidase)
VDKRFKSHWEGARREGILRGAYHYLFAGQDPIKQADLFISTLGADRGELPPIVDLEDKYNENEPNRKIISTCKAMLDRIEQAVGRKPMIYSRTTYLQDHVSVNRKAPAWAKEYPLWVAQYPWVFRADGMPNKNMPTQPEGWSNWLFWQYSEKAIIDGVTDNSGLPTACDLDWFRGTVDDLYAFANIQKREPIEYIAKQGDTIPSIAEQHNISLQELLDANPGLAKAGSKFVIPVPTIPEPIDEEEGRIEERNPTPFTRVHVVKPGESLSFIAIKYGVTVDAIMAINPEIANRNFISVEQAIVIPSP